ncbi:hypothetical protein ACGFJ7_30765 [Actinoplanes sp. NPDC048988]|uniref:hypothetical protein n=1 Tax=Actinoplanes sp. NPDC048988 TaxID=3363901 RepID=UPI00371F339A
MIRPRRLAALTMLVAVALALLPGPAGAAPADVEGEVQLRNLTLAAGGGTVEEGLPVLLFADEAGWADSVTLTFDTSQVNVAEVEVGPDCDTGAVLRCVVPGPHRVYERPGEDGVYGYSTLSPLWLSLTPKAGAAAGDSGTLSVATSVDGGAATTETATIRIGEGVDLTAVDDEPMTVAPGGSVTLRPRVRNSGPTPVDGLTALFHGDDEALAGTNFGNCVYGYAMVCTFDTRLTPGATYRISEPFTLSVPKDAVAGSQTSLGVQWLTAAEWEDWQGGEGERPGTGPDLELEEVSVSAAGVPQADTDKDDNGSSTTVTVTGGRRTDVVALGATVPGTAGNHTIAVGFVNQGPGTLRYPPFLNNAAFVRVSLPAPMSVVTADERCTSLAGEYAAPPSAAVLPDEYSCNLRSLTLRPGQQVKFAFTVRMAEAVHDDKGLVQVDLFTDGESVDRDLRNNLAEIRVTEIPGGGGGGGLPITGAAAATIAGWGIVLVLAGAAVVAALRRRTAHR